MSQLFPDFEKFGKLSKNGRESQRRPKTRPRGANLRACNLGCAKYTVYLVHGNGASGRGEIFFFYASDSGGGCTSSPRTAMPPVAACARAPFQYIELSHPGNLKCPSFWNWYFSDCSNCSHYAQIWHSCQMSLSEPSRRCRGSNFETCFLVFGRCCIGIALQHGSPDTHGIHVPAQTAPLKMEPLAPCRANARPPPPFF